MNRKISELPLTTELDWTDVIAVVQNEVTKQVSIDDLDTYISTTFKETSITLEDGDVVNLDNQTYKNKPLLIMTWTGGNGDAILNLPTASSFSGRSYRFVSNGTFQNSTHARITPAEGDTIDGGGIYTINKSYEGLLIYSTGQEWIIIQKKAH